MDLEPRNGKRKRDGGGNIGEEIALNVGGGSEELLRPISQPPLFNACGYDNWLVQMTNMPLT